MKNILIPTDFSEVARSSTSYAANLCNHLGIQKVVLYNAYSMPLATEMSWAVLQTEELHSASIESLAEFKEMLAKLLPSTVEIVTLSEFGFLTERVDEIAKKHDIDLIIMGATGGNKFEEVLIGSNTIHVVENTDIPVLIIPHDAKWQPVNKIGWACDYKDVLRHVPTMAIKHMVKELSAKLIVVHNDKNPNDFDPEMYKGNAVVASLFHDLNPEMVTISAENFAEGMNDFAVEHQIDMLLVVPKKRGWLESLFKTRFTTQLAFHAHVPLLCIKAVEN